MYCSHYTFAAPWANDTSKGHVGWFQFPGQERQELYKGPNGDLYCAPAGCVIDVNTGYRIGRWECPARMADETAKRLMAA